MVLNKAHVEPEAKPNQRKLGPERQNLYIGKKIEIRGGGTCILFKRW